MKKQSKRGRSQVDRIEAPKASTTEKTATVIPNTASDHIGLRGECLIALFLVVLVLISYAQVFGFDFVNYDDREYVADTPYIFNGITLAGIKQAVFHDLDLLWIPVTALSYMAGCSVYGLNPSGHHLTNLAIHIANVLILFYVLKRLTSRT